METIKKSNRGGKRAGAGRKKGVPVGAYKGRDEVLNKQVVMRVKNATYERIRRLREATKNDTMPFNRMFESWVEEMAQDYGIE